MLEKFDQSLENLIYIHKNTNERQARSLLLAKVEQVEALGKQNLVDKQKLWLLRDSSVAGLITFESIVYDHALDQWLIQNPVRYMNSVNKGWVINSKAFASPAFDEIVKQSGGRQEITSENEVALIERLVIQILKTKNCSMADHISPLVQKNTHLGAKNPHVEARKDFSLPDYLVNILICPLTKEDIETAGLQGALPLMTHPVVLKDDGKTYERDVLVARYKELGIDLEEGAHYYNNFVLRSIIRSIPTLETSPTEYSEIFKKIDEDELMDAITHDNFEEAVISPSGFSFSKKAITEYIDAKKTGLMEPVVSDPMSPDVAIGKMDLIPNENLELFVRLWPEFYNSIDSKVELK
ncbi:hypothetical protein TUM19329_02930 [Legionella antarctica]|uniref:U-box domain-containing protein n=1 Tax=Legionella antarctica TaxID=2708020 RepID=A0A6F8T1P0_9GAMM|nr:hypothetical protein [Legionella antarctica]BCA93932.1 hypothetical protein TUM19329_02930 [Legionella antarctica]